MSHDASGGNKGKDETEKKKKMPRYSAERVIGSGSFGVVYKAMNIQTKQTVAIKKVREDRRYKVEHISLLSVKCFSLFFVVFGKRVVRHLI